MVTEVLAPALVRASERLAEEHQAEHRAREGGLPAEGGQHLAFRLGHEEYALDILHVQEIRGYTEPMRIANAPPFLKGVINLRGAIVPVIDLRIKLGAEAAYGGATVTIVLDVGSRVVGVVVDAVSDVVQFTPEWIKPVPRLGEAATVDHVSGIATLRDASGDRMLIVVDVDALIGAPRTGLHDGLPN
jgi:purine-binding chemotaxis protein CheW